ncbi:MAG: DUF465 domain-containing protein [Caulobacter sp.]|nr:DUF465 domain-containing protein [Caulobacter sp.]
MADNDGEMIPMPNVEIRAQLLELRQRHQDLNAAVEALGLMPTPDQLQIARLKKQKLVLRDQITKLENMLTPDLLA